MSRIHFAIGFMAAISTAYVLRLIILGTVTFWPLTAAFCFLAMGISMVSAKVKNLNSLFKGGFYGLGVSMAAVIVAVVIIPVFWYVLASVQAYVR